MKLAGFWMASDLLYLVHGPWRIWYSCCLSASWTI